MIYLVYYKTDGKHALGPFYDLTVSPTLISGCADKEEPNLTLAALTTSGQWAISVGNSLELVGAIFVTNKE